MSKSTVKCPNCGKQVPSNMRFCGWCGFDMKAGSSQRVDTLPRPGQAGEQTSRVPRQPGQPPAAPQAPGKTQEPAPAAPSVQQPSQPAQPPVQKPVQPPRQPAQAKKQPVQPKQQPVPPQKPVNTNRRTASAGGAGGGNNIPPHKKNTGLIIGILAAAVVVIVVVILLVRINKPGGTPTPETTESVHIMNAGEDEATQAPEATEAPATPEATPTAAPEPETEEPNGTVYVTGSGVNLRSGPGTTYEVVASLARGTELERTGTTNGWSQVIYNGEECYVSSALISTEKPADLEEPEATEAPAGEPERPEASEAPEVPADAVSDTVVVTSNANVRSGPGTDYDSLGTVAAGTELERVGVSGDWSKVKYNGGEGYIFNNLLTEKGEAGTLTVVAKANVRSGPGTEYDVVVVVDAGQMLTMLDHTESNWYEVDVNGQTGYIAGNMVTEN